MSIFWSAWELEQKIGIGWTAYLVLVIVLATIFMSLAIFLLVTGINEHVEMGRHLRKMDKMFPPEGR